MKQVPRIVLFIESSSSYGRGLLKGITRYANLNGPWYLLGRTPFLEHKQMDKLLSSLKSLKVNGMIIRESEVKKIKDLFGCGIPMIVSPHIISSKVPTILVDEVSIANLAVDHLLGLGLRNFASVSFKNIKWSNERCEQFKKILTEAGFIVNNFKMSQSFSIFSEEKELELLEDWLKKLPKPVGIMACNDYCGSLVIEVCRVTGIHVPDQVAVIGVDNDELNCESNMPQLSSVAVPSEEAGFQAASLLDSLMHGEKMEGQVILHHPTHVVTRSSTDIIAIEDSDVAEAIRYIRLHCHEGIQVNDVVQALCLSRRTLHAKFIKMLGRSVGDEIAKVKVGLIEKYLTETDWSISTIAERLGFIETSRMSRFFSKMKGVSPASYRQMCRSCNIS